MNGAGAPGGGLLHSLRRLLATVVELAHLRLELLTTELEQEKLRVFESLLRGAVAILLVNVGLLLFVGWLVLLVAEGYRMAALGVLALIFLGGGVWLARHAREHLRGGGGLLSGTRAELAQDRDALKPGP
jgi:uncharacterized membrane protein YqjE